MPVEVISKHLGDGVIVLKPVVYRDERGFFFESYREDHFSALGIRDRFVQDNHSGSVRGVIRGLHFQWDPPMAKLMRVTVGKALLVAVDIRKGSPTLGRYFAVEASAENGIQVYAGAGFARGFCALSEFVEVQYKCTAIYNPKGESGIRWNDRRVGIPWPVAEPILSAKDRDAQSLDEWLRRPEADTFTCEP